MVVARGVPSRWLFGDYEKLKTPLQDHILASLSAFHLFFGLAMAS